MAIVNKMQFSLKSSKNQPIITTNKTHKKEFLPSK